MVTLAVDTATLCASGAIAENGKILVELNLQYGKTHSEKIVPMIKTMLDMTGMDAADIDLYAASVGPGSFTGLRIGVVTVKGFAYAHKKPVCGIMTLDALAYSMPDFKGIISPMLDARNNQVFTALYRKENDRLEKILPETGIHIDEWADKLDSFNEDVLILGDAVSLHFGRLKSRLNEKVIRASNELSYTRAAAVALLAEKAYGNGQYESAFDLKPMYLRKSQAERMKELGSRN